MEFKNSCFQRGLRNHEKSPMDFFHAEQVSESEPARGGREERSSPLII